MIRNKQKEKNIDLYWSLCSKHEAKNNRRKRTVVALNKDLMNDPDVTKLKKISYIDVNGYRLPVFKASV